MALPSAIADALAEVRLSELPGTPVDTGRMCAGAKIHSPSPLLLHEVQLPDGKVLLCGTCRDNLSVLALLIEQHGLLEWPVRRSFGNRLRALLIPKEPDG